jgi:SAM-dependent methyltransferase
MSDQLECICLANLERMINDGEKAAPTITAKTIFQQRVEAIQSRMARIQQIWPRDRPGSDLAGMGSAFLSVLLPALFDVAAEAEGYADVPCDGQKRAIRDLRGRCRNYYQYMSYQLLVTRYFAQHFFSRMPFQHPSLEIGTDDGVTTKLTFKGQLTVGSNPSLPELVHAKKLSTHKQFVCLDATQIPYADNVFQSAIMIYTFYHLTDRNRVLRELHRVLAPGGMLAFIDTRRHIEGWLPLTHLLEGFGFHKMSQELTNQWFSRYDSNRQYVESADYAAFLESHGYEVVALHPFMSQPVTSYVYFTYLFDNLFGTNGFMDVGSPNVEEHYLRFAENTLGPMLAKDAEWSAESGESSFLFVLARKKGITHKGIGERDLANHLRCPRDGSPLSRVGPIYRSREGGIEYPVIDEIPLLIPFYADWLRERAKHGKVPRSRSA